MVRAYINSVEVELTNDVITNRNRKETPDYGKITILNERKERYEPLTIVEIGEAGDLEQYLIQADEPLLLKDTLYEHKMNLVETIEIFGTIFPVDRSFTTGNDTIRSILDTYIRELRFYQDFDFTYTDDALFDTKLPNKEYVGASLAEIVYDLFRIINSIPRVKFINNEWVLTYELYTQRNNAITLSVEGEQSTVNDIDYATEVLAKSRNAVDESNFIWYPSKTGYITPRTEGTMFQTSALRYELPDPIIALESALTRIDIYGLVQFIDTSGIEYTDVVNLNFPVETYLDVDITDNILSTDEFNALKSVGNDFASGGTDNTRVKENCLSFDFEGKYIENLFSQIKGFLNWTDNIFHLRSAINSNVYKAVMNAWDDLVDNYLYDEITEVPASAEIKTYYKSLTNEQIFNVTAQLRGFYSTEETEEIGLRFKYRPKRDIDFVTEKYNIGSLNKSTIMNNQSDSFIDIGRYIENNNALANRIGNVINNVTQSFDTWAERWQLGDYVGEWLIIDVRYQIDTNNITCIADMAKGFTNTDREYSMSNLPSDRTFTGKVVQSNFVYRQYIELYEEFVKDDSSLLTDLSKRIALNIFGYNDIYNKPLRHATFYGENQYVDAPLIAVGRGNTMLWHFSFDDPRIAGNGMIKQTSARQGSYAWYKNPLFYANPTDFTLDNMRLTLNNEVNFKEDTNEIKYYPEVFLTLDDYWNNKRYPIDKDTNASLAFTNELVIYTNNDNIVIGNAFTKYNNLIREFDTEPTLDLYEGVSAYTVFDKYVRDTDTLVNDAQVNLTATEPYTLTVLDSLDSTLEYWCLAYDNEIVIAGNNNISEIKFNFRNNRERVLIVTVIDKVVQPEITISVDITEDINQFEFFIVAPEITITPTITEDVERALYVVNVVQPEIVINTLISEQIIQIENVVYTVQPELMITAITSESITQTENVINTVQPQITLQVETSESISAVEYESVVIQPQIILQSIIEEQITQTESIVNTVQPQITLNATIVESITAQVLIVNIVQPVITLTSTLTSTQGELEHYLELLSTTPTVDYGTTDSGYISTFASANSQTTIETEWGSITGYTAGDIFTIDKGYIEQIAPDTQAFTLTVSSGDLTNYSAILSAMQSQQTQYYNDMVADTVPSEVIFRVDDGTNNTYYKILLVADRIQYYELKTRII